MKELTLERFLQFLRRNDMEDIDKIVFFAVMKKDDERFRQLFMSYPGFEDVAYWVYGMLDASDKLIGEYEDITIASFIANMFWCAFNCPTKLINQENDKDILCSPGIISMSKTCSIMEDGETVEYYSIFSWPCHDYRIKQNDDSEEQKERIEKYGDSESTVWMVSEAYHLHLTTMPFNTHFSYHFSNKREAELDKEIYEDNSHIWYQETT